MNPELISDTIDTGYVRGGKGEPITWVSTTTATNPYASAIYPYTIGDASSFTIGDSAYTFDTSIAATSELEKLKEEIEALKKENAILKKDLNRKVGMKELENRLGGIEEKINKLLSEEE